MSGSWGRGNVVDVAAILIICLYCNAMGGWEGGRQDPSPKPQPPGSTNEMTTHLHPIPLRLLLTSVWGVFVRNTAILAIYAIGGGIRLVINENIYWFTLG